jgi:hypothetical protein
MSLFTIDEQLYPDCKPFIEQATTLIKAGRQPRIEIVGIPFSVRSKPLFKFKTYQARIYELFRDPSYAVGTCLHEGAHGVLMEEDGIPNKFLGPGIRYNRESKTLFPYGARIEPGKQTGRTATLAVIFEGTTHIAVGGVAMQKYAGIMEVSDDQDCKDFLSKYATMPEELRTEKPADLWKRAQENARTRLDIPETKAKIFAKVPEYLALLYTAS